VLDTVAEGEGVTDDDDILRVGDRFVGPLGISSPVSSVPF
jgi:hypothetical protein